jgi:hypothetical protein
MLYGLLLIVPHRWLKSTLIISVRAACICTRDLLDGVRQSLRLDRISSGAAELVHLAGLDYLHAVGTACPGSVDDA